MLASKETNEPVHKLGKSPTTLPSHQQGTPLKYKINWLIPEKKSQGGKKVPTVHTGMTSLLSGAHWLPSADSLLQLPSVGATSATLVKSERKIFRASDLCSCQGLN